MTESKVIRKGNKVSIMENAYYSVISPEGCAAILWKDRAQAARAAEAMKLDAEELIKYGIADEILEGESQVDVLVNNAGVNYRVPVLEFPRWRWLSSFRAS